MNAVRLAEVRLVDTVDLSELDTLLLEAGRSLLVVGSKGLAVTAPADTSEVRTRLDLVCLVPRGKELDKHQRLRVDSAVEVGGGEVDDIRGEDGLDEGERGGRRERSREPHREKVENEGKGEGIWAVATPAAGL